MILLLPLISTVLLVRIMAGMLNARGHRVAAAWATWPAALAAGMAVVFISTSITHFIEPQRSGLIAIVPQIVPFPELAVTVTGILECVLAIGLLLPRTRRLAALFSVLLLLALFPANVVATTGADHPAAPSTALVPRILLQLLFICCAAAPLMTRRTRAAKHRA